jgi:magnesium-protoporphyrin O-methyltransferase
VKACIDNERIQLRDCCANVLDAKFDARNAEQQARAYRRSGPARETQLLIDALCDAGVAGASVLDIGGGIGAVQLGLLAAGANRVVSVEASSGSINFARSLAREHGYADRIEYRCGDFIDLATEIPEVDVVTLDKVICCYPEMDALVERSAGRAARLYAAVYPRDALYIRLVNRVQNMFRRLVRSDFRTWIHSTAAIEQRLQQRGFRLRSVTRTMIWQIAVFERADSS